MCPNEDLFVIRALEEAYVSKSSRTISLKLEDLGEGLGAAATALLALLPKARPKAKAGGLRLLSSIVVKVSVST